MLKKISETRKICDICENEKNIFHVCSVCKKDVCFNCEVSDNFQHRASICRVCSKVPKIKEILDRYKDKHWKLVYEEQRVMGGVKINRRKGVK